MALELALKTTNLRTKGRSQGGGLFFKDLNVVCGATMKLKPLLYE